MNLGRIFFPAALLLALLFPGCAAREVGSHANVHTIERYSTRGVVQRLGADGTTVVIEHDEIPGYMPAMVMPFEVRNRKELSGLNPGDIVSFDLVVTETDGWIERVRKMQGAATVPQSAQTGSSDADSLRPGILVPNYSFTNQFGQPVELRQWRGNALAVTFTYTACPFPNFCPRLARNFQKTQNALKNTPGAPTNWHLLSVSFDPENDTVEVLKAYAESNGYDPQRWTFATGDFNEIIRATQQFGIIDWGDPADPDGQILRSLDEAGSMRRQRARKRHNLRTAVLDVNGRVHAIFWDNEWNSEQLVTEMINAAAVKPAVP